MKMITRRGSLQCATVAGGALALTACERSISFATRRFAQSIPDEVFVAESDEIDDVQHLLNRAAYGPWPGDVSYVKSIGLRAWLDEQLQPENIEDLACEIRARRFESIYFKPGNAYEFKENVLREELSRHTLLRAIYSKKQLFEVMVGFWTDHLNIDLGKGDCIYFKPWDDINVIRKHALGNFKDLIRASVTSPAMLVYLDGKENKKRKGTDDIPNENYARELMELHTMGVHGGYSQKDVSEAARCLTGWTLKSKKAFLDRGKVIFQVSHHDPGGKTVLGKTIPARKGSDGEADLEDLIDIVCAHPATAQYISTKLCRRFVGYEPPESLVSRVTTEFTKSGGDIKTLLRVILLSDEFAQSKGRRFKRPFRYIVSTLRVLGADTHAHKPLIEYFNRMGHTPFSYPTPDGYPEEEMPWMGTLLWRWNFAFAVVNGEVPDVNLQLKRLGKAVSAIKEGKVSVEKTWAYLLGRDPTKDEMEAIDAYQKEMKSGGSHPDEQVELLAVIMASPAFQRC